MSRREYFTCGTLSVEKILSNPRPGTSVVNIGSDEDGQDVKFFGATSGSYMLWDESADELVFDAADLHLGDSDELRFGDSDDFVWKFDSADFSILPASDVEAMNVGSTTNNINVTLNGTLTVGQDDTGYDVKLFGTTDGAYALWDESDVAFILAKAEIEFDSYKSAGAFDFANDGTVVKTTSSSTGTLGAVKVTLGGTTGYIHVYSGIT